MEIFHYKESHFLHNDNNDEDCYMFINLYYKEVSCPFSSEIISIFLKSFCTVKSNIAKVVSSDQEAKVTPLTSKLLCSFFAWK